MAETTALYITFALGIIFAIIGALIAFSVKTIEKNIKTLFDKAKENETNINGIKLDMVKNYVTKEDCRDIEKSRLETDDRIKNYRDRYKKAEQGT